MVTATETQSHPLQRNTFKKPWKNELKDYVMIAIGTAFYGLGVTLFMLPYKLTTGGIAGALYPNEVVNLESRALSFLDDYLTDIYMDIK